MASMTSTAELYWGRYTGGTSVNDSEALTKRMSTMTRKRRIGGTMAVDGSSAKAYVGYKSNYYRSDTYECG